MSTTLSYSKRGNSNDYKLNEVIGHGSYSIVYRAWDKVNRRPVAIKVIDPSNYPRMKNAIRYIYEELDIMKQFDHPNVLKLYAYFVKESNTSSSLSILSDGSTAPRPILNSNLNRTEDMNIEKQNQRPPKRKICVVTEYCDGGTLKDWLITYRRQNSSLQKNRNDNIERIKIHIPMKKNVTKSKTYHPMMRQSLDEQCRSILSQIVTGYRTMFNAHILHRDLKPDNILLSFDTSSDIDQMRRHELTRYRPVIKLADFGFSKNMKQDNLTRTMCGTPLYMAPEIFDRTGYTAKADIWSLGIIAYEMLEGKKPFKARTHNELLLVISKREPLSFSKGAPALWCDFITRALEVDVEKRFSWQQVFQHQLITEFVKQNQQYHDDLKGLSQSCPAHLDDFKRQRRAYSAMIPTQQHRLRAARPLPIIKQNPCKRLQEPTPFSVPVQDDVTPMYLQSPSPKDSVARHRHIHTPPSTSLVTHDVNGRFRAQSLPNKLLIVEDYLTLLLPQQSFLNNERVQTASGSSSSPKSEHPLIFKMSHEY